MQECLVPISGLDLKTQQQLKYSTFFIDEHIADVYEKNGSLVIEHDSDDQEIAQKVGRLIERFTEHEFVFKENILFRNSCEVPYKDNIIEALKARRIVRELESGIFTFREPFTTILRFFDHRFVSKIGRAFNVTEEYYPVVIQVDTLNKTSHFTSFPEHIQFVMHLREDLDVIDLFANDVRTHGGLDSSMNINTSRNMRPPGHAINPATCYHCYEALQDETVEGDGKAVTAVSKAHRYESKNHRDFGRLLDFTMREIIFVGTPAYVKENRTKSLNLLMELVKEWELDCFIENANDPFFTNDYKVKASFQRLQDMKYELRMNIPYLGRSIAVSSSNFHSNTFGKAFNITAGRRPAATGCLAFGLERWVFSFLAQYGLDEAKWPKQLHSDWVEWRNQNV
ncbi:MAG TPA: hypothetical protein VEG39_04240 [Clostridia bacterium]|nr:hypothetical protein [Clostridia bacterium]